MLPCAILVVLQIHECKRVSDRDARGLIVLLTLDNDRVETLPLLQELVCLQVVLLVGMTNVQVLRQLLQLLGVVLDRWAFDLL